MRPNDIARSSGGLMFCQAVVFRQIGSTGLQMGQMGRQMLVCARRSGAKSAGSRLVADLLIRREP